MKLKEIVRTATFAWSPGVEPTLATGTVAGALDASFSNDAHLEIWSPDMLDRATTIGSEGGVGPKGIVTTSSRFNRLAWGYVNTDRPMGVLAAGLESGHLELWDPAQITHETDVSSARLLQNNTHTGPVRALHFNSLQNSLLASGSTGSELYIWDLENPSTPYTPGARSQRLDGVSSLAWNAQVAHILASSSMSGYTVVWDLRGKREVVALQYGGGGGPVGGVGVGGAGVGGVRRGMSDVAWHPDNATRLITASEDDASPIIMLWDLRNARAPEKILQGHERGVLSVSWCPQDPDLLLSCGKDNRTLVWNPNSGEILGQLPPSNNWSFLTSWNPRNPDIFATANYDGSIAMHSIQSTSPSTTTTTAPKAPANPNDVFDPANFADTADAQNLGSSVNLERAPKWLKVPVGGRFGFGGVLVEVSNTGAEEEKKQPKVQIKQVVGEKEVVERAKALIKAEEEEGGMRALVESRAAETPAEGTDAPAEAKDAKDTYSTLLALFDSDPKSALIKLVGYDTSPAALDEALAAVRAKTYEPVVSFAPEAVHVPHSPVGEEEPEGAPDTTDEQGEGNGDEASEGTDVPGAAPSEVSAFSSDAKMVDAASTATEPSLFGDEPVGGTPGPAAGDFFNTLASDNDSLPSRPRAGLVPHLSYTGESSAAATIGSRSSSIAGDAPLTPSLPAKSFRMHPKKEDATSALVTRALITGNLDTAVELCIQAGRWADALLLAQGEGLVMRTRMAYFDHSGDSTGGYLRVFKGVVQGRKGLAELVRGSEVGEWREMLVVLCRWAESDNFAGLVGELGERVWVADMAKEEKREAARVCFMAGKKLDKLVRIWDEEAREEEQVGEAQGGNYSVRAKAVQGFVEKAVAFCSAVGFVDPDLSSSTEGREDYPLALLYDRYLEYAQILSAQGLVSEAVRYVDRVPTGYGDVQWLKGAFEKDKANRTPVAPKGSYVPPAAAGPYGAASSYGASSYGAPSTGPYGNPPGGAYAGAGYNPPPPSGPYGAPPAPSSGPYGAPPAPSSGPYGAPPPAPSGPYAPSPSTTSSTLKPTNSYGPQTGYTPPAPSGGYAPPGQQGGYGAPAQPGYNAPGQAGSYQTQQPGFRAPMVAVPPPPAPIDQASGPPPPRIIPASQRRDIPGWNDAPNVTVPQRRTPAPAAPPAAAITSPFPNSPAPGSPSTSGPPRGTGTPQRVMSPSGGPPPPPRGMSPQTGPPRGSGLPPPPRPQSGAYAPPPPPSAPSGAYAPPPPSAPSGAYAPPPQNAGAYAPPPQAGGAYAPPPPPPGVAPGAPPPPPSGAYAPPPGQAHPPPPPPGNAGTSWAPQGGPPPPPGGAPRTGTPTAPPAKPPPKAPKYPPGDREHIPQSDRIIFEVLTEQLARLRQSAPPQQKRMVDDLERRLNALFDALNCETLSRPVVEQLVTLVQAMQAHDGPGATAIHVDLLTRGSRTDDIGLWMSAVKQLIIRL